jgi:SH3-like domain-containing protein
MLRATAILAAALSAGLSGARSANALEFRTVNDTAAVLYDAPSARSQKLYILNRGYPVEVIVAVEGWVKVRDAQGGLAWIESKQLTDKRTVLVRAPVAQIRQKPDEAAPVLFQAQQNVLLELVEVAGTWVQVRHRDGGTGYVKAQQVWGA